jgi:hypothetical protein
METEGRKIRDTQPQVHSSNSRPNPAPLWLGREENVTTVNSGASFKSPARARLIPPHTASLVSFGFQLHRLLGARRRSVPYVPVSPPLVLRSSQIALEAPMAAVIVLLLAS